MTFKKITTTLAITISAVAISACQTTPIADDFDVQGGSGYPTTGSNRANDADLFDDNLNENETSTAKEWVDPQGGFTALPASQQIFKPIYFARNRYTIGTAEAATLDSLAQYLQSNGSLHLAIEGHCSTRGSEEFNMSLGEKRAQAVRQFLESRGIPASRLDTVSYGEERPAKAGNDESAHSANRRSVFVLGRKNN